MNTRNSVTSSAARDAGTPVSSHKHASAAAERQFFMDIQAYVGHQERSSGPLMRRPVENLWMFGANPVDGVTREIFFREDAAGFVDRLRCGRVFVHAFA
jgi:hypothetical protein